MKSQVVTSLPPKHVNLKTDQLVSWVLKMARGEGREAPALDTKLVVLLLGQYILLALGGISRAPTQLPACTHMLWARTE